MKGESDQPSTVLIGTGSWAGEFEDEPELPRLQPLTTANNDNIIRPAPDARIFEAKLNVSNDMTFLEPNAEYRNQKIEYSPGAFGQMKSMFNVIHRRWRLYRDADRTACRLSILIY
jgi:hypothetical protein